MVTCFPLLLFMAAQQAPAAPTHKIDVRVAGPLAMVEVWRTIDARPRTVGNRQTESTQDLGLPDRAALVDWEILERGEHARMAQQTEGQVSAGLTAVLKMRQISPSMAPVDEGIGYRIHLTPLVESARNSVPPIVHYRYVMPVGCSEGRLSLHMPESLDENPIPAEVTVSFDPHPDGFPLARAVLAGKPAELRPGTRRLVMRGLSPARSAWDVSWSFAATHAAFPGQALVALAALPKGKGAPARTATLAVACLAQGPAEAPSSRAKAEAPGSVTLLVDRSRSVGQGGLSEERVVARSLLEALPPSVPFNAILFGETATPLFPIPRMPTREAIEALSNAADPNHLEKSTDLVAALARAHKAYLPGADGHAWIVVITDGALPASQTAQRMQEALAGAERTTRVLVLLVRQRGDDDVSRPALAQYARLVERFGGLIREVPSGSAEETARAAVRAMAKGGDWFGLRVDDLELADVLPAGQGATAWFSQTSAKGLGTRRKVRFVARGPASSGNHSMATIRLDVGVATVKSEWLQPLIEGEGGKRRAWAGATSSVAVAVLPAPPAPKKVVDEIVHGRLDETVLRNALSLAFMPRARACYLSRRVATANDAYLRGRVRLELTIERGELHEVVVRRSTLNNPEIENCLRQAAWAVDYPRPEHRDALTVANLNLVFRPRTSEEARPDASVLDREIELVLGPLTFTQDFSDLLEDRPAQKSAAP